MLTIPFLTPKAKADKPPTPTPTLADGAGWKPPAVKQAERCWTCRYMQYRKPDEKKGAECRRGPPSVLMVPVANALTRQQEIRPAAVWPPVPTEGWCGEWRGA